MNTTYPFHAGRMMLLALAAFMVFGLRATALEPAPPDELLVNTIRVNKVLFLGNSITLHGPAENIGWSGNWGMAASAQDKDYVHLLLARLQQASGGKPQVMVQNIADFERTHASYDIEKELHAELAFAADLVVIAIGENVAELNTPALKADYQAAFEKLLTSLKQHGAKRIIIRGTFWNDPTKNGIMSAAAKQAEATYVDLQGLDQDEKNFARAERKFEHAGVAAHPGDQGMQAIADAIWKAM